ncbi:Polycystin-1 [Bagarius yarrelli]|uniref:Polycystin-1 n=1 Tax=Bagarius yarrelli TaxID=175774 RepID=A0A556TL39_BAGYA|nr:Polycystin-1 [Bagarius yarrelli]
MTPLRKISNVRDFVSNLQLNISSDGDFGNCIAHASGKEKKEEEEEKEVLLKLFFNFEMDVSSNPFVCACKLVHLVNRLQMKGVTLRRASHMLCDHPPKLKDQPLLNVSADDCELYYAGCLQDDAHSGGSELVIFTSSVTGNFSREECNSRCFFDKQLYGGLGSRRECLCSTNSEPNYISEARCSAACSNATVMRDCGLTVAQDVFQVEKSVDFSVHVTAERSSVHSEVAFSVSSSVLPVSLCWDFGDASPPLNTSITTAHHKYGLPGRYRAKVIATATHREKIGMAEVHVELPPRLELQCPSMLLANQSLEEAVTLVNWGGVGVAADWRIRKEGSEVARAEPVCVSDSAYHQNSSRCFELVPDEFSWSEARRQCVSRGGELAVARCDTVRSLIAQRITHDRDSPGFLHWVDGSPVLPGQDGPKDWPTLVDGNMCVSLGSDGQTSLHPCNAKRAYVCQFNHQGVYRVGMAMFNNQNIVTSTKVSYSARLETPGNNVELLLFPSLSFTHSGRLSSLELITHTLSSQTHVRFQVYRPHCQRGLHLLLPGCTDLCGPIATCQSLDNWPNNTNTATTYQAPPCPEWHQWCPFVGSCLRLSLPCHPGLCPNCSRVGPLPLGTLRPHYSLVEEVLFILPPGATTLTLVQEEIEDLLVVPGDFIALQHDAGPSGLVECSSDSSSPWKQSILVQNRSDWLDSNETLDLIGDGKWLDELICKIRVLYVGQNETKLRGPFLNAGLPETGDYSLEVTSDDPDFPVTASCSIHVIPPLSFTLIFPTNHNGTVYFLPNKTLVLVSVRSEHSAVIGWHGSNKTVPFQRFCPQELNSRVVECKTAMLNNDTLFAWLDLELGSTPGLIKVVLHAQSELTETDLEIQAKVEEPLHGLQIQPHPAHRVLMETVVSYTASVEGGTDPSFRWTVDDKPYFTYYNTVLNIIYQNAAVYKLTVTATNHVSNLSEDFNVTVDKMSPMSEITVRGVPEIVTQGEQLTLSASVAVDISVDATFLWLFTDGDKMENHFKPPYVAPHQSPDPSDNRIVLQHEVKYTYKQPGEYNLRVSVSNRHENKTCKLDVYVFSILTSVEINTEPELLQADKPAAFEAHPLPSPYGIIYTWDFGDNSSLRQGRERRIYHAYGQRGTYTVCVNVNNTVSSKDSCKVIMVYEYIDGLEVKTPAPTELNTPVFIVATLESGNNVSWSYSMGDGNVLMHAEPWVEHIYNKDGNYTVNVTATNAISSKWKSIHIQVFVLQVLRLEPAECVQVKQDINFYAFVSGNSSTYQYMWSFGDETTNETQYGTPTIKHTYQNSGNYHLSLLISSSVNKAIFLYWICVQPEVSNVTLEPSSRFIRLGEDSRFTVTAFPEFDYAYLWDFGTNDSKGPVAGGNQMFFMYKSPGLYLITVTVLNNISHSISTVQVEVQQPVGYMLIQHNGTKGNNLALGQDYTFIITSYSDSVAYRWEFGDGTVLTGHNVTHAYNSSGIFDICVTGQNNVSENKSRILVAVLSPIQGLSVNASLVNVPLNATVHFETHLDQGDNVHYSWILCDRCTSIPGTHPMYYTFRSVGMFNVIVTAENDISTAQASIYIFVQRELEGLQIVSDELGESCCFATNRIMHLQAVLKDGTNMSFIWNLLKENENTGVLNLTGKNIELNYTTPGPCEVFLKATNLLGQLAVNRTIEFFDPVGRLVLEAFPNPTATNTISNVTVAVNTGSDLQYRWWIDGNPLQFNLPFIQHKFDSPGLKSVNVEVSNQVSKEMSSVQISVQEPISGVTFTTTNVTEQNFIASGVNVSLSGNVQTGSNVSWLWMLPNHAKSGQQVTYYIFSSPGTFTVSLNVSNDISCEVLSRDFTVEDRIQGLEFRASKKNVAVGENVEFTVSVTSGTSVSYTLSISGDATVHPNLTYIHKFSRVDNYYVNLTAWNQISSERKNLHICVLEPITKLSILDCCEEAIPVGVPKTFEAHIQTGNPVRYLWTFDLHHGAKTTVLDSKATYVPDEPGLLTISVSAFNALNIQNETKNVIVQNVLKSAILEAQPSDTFINKTLIFQARVTPQSSSLRYQWDFGDGSPDHFTDTSVVSHVYFLPGHYTARVNISNLVSWITVFFQVNIRVLECSEPEVQVVQAPRIAIWRSKPAFVEAKVDLKGCVRYGAEFLWEIFSASHCQEFENHLMPPFKVYLPAEIDFRRLQLSIPKMTLPAKNYTLIFSLSYKGIPLKKTACLQLSVMSAKLVPIIEGGTYRVWSKTQDLQLNANQSYDPNLDLESQTLLNYRWECVNTSKGSSHCSTLNFRLGPKDLVISGSELEVDVEYTFRLTINKDGMSSESTTQKVLVKSGRIPFVSLECVSCKAQSRYKISQNSYVYLAGTCSNCQGTYRGRWTAVNCHSERLVLDLNTTTTGQDSMNLVLRKGSLRDGDSYVFSLHVTDDSMEQEGVANIKLYPNLPPAGGSCSLWVDGEGPDVHTLLEKVHFNCTGYTDSDETESQLVYSLLVLRCFESYCEDFCVYKGTSPEHSTFLPPGLRSAQFRVSVSITVEDHQGASITALNKTMTVMLPQVPAGFSSLAHWLSVITGTTLNELLKQGDSQRVRELSLALITVLNGYEQGVQYGSSVSKQERQYRVSVRGNITRALTSLDLNTVSDIQQTSAALAQCTSMLEILQTDTKKGTVTPTEIADNILNIMGDLIQQVSEAASAPLEESEDKGTITLSYSLDQPHPLRVAAKAYTLSSELMRILMLSRVLNEEPLILRGAEIAAAGKHADPLSLLCYGSSNAPECRRFSIPRAFNSSLGTSLSSSGGASEGIVQLLFQVEPNPFPFNYVPNYTVSTEVASMEFRTVNGSQIPIADLDESQAIRVALNNGTAAELDGNSTGVRLDPSGAVNVSRCGSVIVKVSTGNNNRRAGVYVQLNFTVVEGSLDAQNTDLSIMAYLHTSDKPNEYCSTNRKRISLSMVQRPDADHQLYTFFLSPIQYDTTQDHFINVTAGCTPDWPVRIRVEVGVFMVLCQYFSELGHMWQTDGMVPLPETSAGQAVCSTRHLTVFGASLLVPSHAISFTVHDPPLNRSLVVLLVCVVCLLCYAVAAAVLRKLDQLDLRRDSVVPLCGKDGIYKYEIQVKTGWTRGAGTTAHVGISLHGSESRSSHRHLDRVGAFTRNSLDIFHIATDSSLGNLLKIRVWHDNKAWLLQYVLVKDLQTGSSYFFLVEEWLSVDNEKTDGRVEIEAEPSEGNVLLCASPPYHARKHSLVCHSNLQQELPSQVDQESLEIDDFLDNSLNGSSFLIFNGITETYSEETNIDLPTPSSKRWSVPDCDWPDVTSDSSVELGAGLPPRLKRGQGSRHLGVDMNFNPEDDETVVGHDHRNKYFTSSDEDLLKRILADGQLLSQTDSDMADISSIFGDKTEVILLQKMSESVPTTVRRDPPKTAFTSRTGVYFGLLVARLRPEEGDVLVDCPRMERVNQRVPRVRPPQGFALSQAREEARKVRLLHSMLKSFLLYMLFLLVVLLLNYTDSTKDSHQLRLHTQLKNTLNPQSFNNISRREDVWAWLSNFLLPQLLDGSALKGTTGSLLLGKPRLRQQRFQPACPSGGYYPAAPWFGCDTAGWAESGSALTMNWSQSVSQSNGAWHWGQVSVYNSGGFIQELSRQMEESRALIEQLHKHQWLDPLTRALFVEFSLYNTNTDLLVIFSFLLEFPISERAQSSINIKTCSLQTLQRGMDLPLFLTVILMILIIYFSVREGLSTIRQGWGYILQVWNLVGVLTLLLAASVSVLQFTRSALASHLWDSLLRQRESFIDFYPLGQQCQVLLKLNAMLLFLLVLKAAHQLRFLREWAVFGKTLRRSAWEIVSIAVALLLLVLAYSHTGYLMFYSIIQGCSTVRSACLSLVGLGGRGLWSWRTYQDPYSCSASCYVFHVSFAALRLVLLWLVTAVLLRNYRRVRAELYRPAVDLQDYEMVELFLRRLKMWMGLSHTKEFRHKVRFEGMEIPPSRSSSTSDCKSLCLPPLDAPEAPPTPDSVDGSEASWHPMSSSPCSLAETPSLGLGLTLSLGVVSGGQTWKDRAETEATLRRVLPAFDALLLHLDKVNQATEDLYRTECRLEKVQKRSNKKSFKVCHSVDQDSAGQRRHNGLQKRSHLVEKCSVKVEKGGNLDKHQNKSSHKTDRGSRKKDTGTHQISHQENLLPKDSSFQKTDMGKLEPCRKVDAHVSKTETHPPKVDSSPIKVEESVVKIEASATVMDAGSIEARYHKPAKSSYKAASSWKKVNVNSRQSKDTEVVGCANKPLNSQAQTQTSITAPSSSLSTAPSTASNSTITTPVPIPRALEWNPPSYNEDLPSSLFQHPAHTATMPTRKRKHKLPHMKNKIHPNTDRPISGHPKP